MVLIDINKFRTNEILNEDNRFRRGENEMNRKFILTRTNDVNELRNRKPSAGLSVAFDKLINIFNKSLLSAIIRNDSFDIEKDDVQDVVVSILSNWNALISFYSHNLYTVFTSLLNDKVANTMNVDYLKLIMKNLIREGITTDRNDLKLVEALQSLLTFIKSKVYQPINFLSPNINEVIPPAPAPALAPAPEEADSDTTIEEYNSDDYSSDNNDDDDEPYYENLPNPQIPVEEDYSSDDEPEEVYSQSEYSSSDDEPDQEALDREFTASPNTIREDEEFLAEERRQQEEAEEERQRQEEADAREVSRQENEAYRARQEHEDAMIRLQENEEDRQIADNLGVPLHVWQQNVEGLANYFDITPREARNEYKQAMDDGLTDDQFRGRLQRAKDIRDQERYMVMGYGKKKKGVKHTHNLQKIIKNITKILKV